MLAFFALQAEAFAMVYMTKITLKNKEAGLIICLTLF